MASGARPTYPRVTMATTIQVIRELKAWGTSPIDNTELQARIGRPLTASEPRLGELHDLARERGVPAPRRGIFRRRR